MSKISDEIAIEAIKFAKTRETLNNLLREKVIEHSSERNNISSDEKKERQEETSLKKKPW